MPDQPARVSRAVSAIAPSATLAVDARAKALRAAGEPVIGFGAGQPDFPTPDHIVAAAVEACRDPNNHGYTPSPGLPELREAIAAKTERDSGYVVAPDQVVVTNGGKHAVYNTMAVLLDPGDEVLLPAPYWTTYPEPVALVGATTTVLPTTAADGFKVSIDRLEAARTDRTKAVVFVSPSNPTGAVYTPDEVAAIGRWAVENDLWVITDEIYEHLVYGDARFSSVPTLVPEIADRCIVLNGVAKTYAMTGWRVGWIIAPPDVAKAAATLQSHQTSNVNNVAQRAALAAVAGPLDAVYAMRAAFDRRRARIVELLRAIDGVECLEPDGAFYAFPSLEGLLGRDFGGTVPTATVELADVILDQAKVAFVPGEAFGAPGYARFSYALDETAMEEGITRIADLVARS